MAKTKKPSAKKGSRFTPRKDARKQNRELMKDAFTLYDKCNELMARFKVGYDEIAERSDVPAEVLAKMKAFIEKHKLSFGELVTLQDNAALAAETLLDNTELKWADIELDITAAHVEMHMRIEEWTAKFAEIMSEAAELATELPDIPPTAPVLTGAEAQPIDVTEGGLFVQGADGETKRLVTIDGETKEVDEATLVLPKEETVVERNGSVANVDENGNLKSLMA